MYKILSIDGGGIRGIISAYWIDMLRKKLDRPLHECFDLIAGTSTGSILASAIACDIANKDEDFIDFYLNHGPKIFKPRSTIARVWPVPSYISPIYYLENLEKSLKEVFSENDTLENAKTKLFIASYDVFTRQPLWMRSYNEDTNVIPIWEACLSSSAAPSYFAANVLTLRDAEKILIDGGVVANNPSACALAEAIDIKNFKSLAEAENNEKILLISLGTGNLVRPIDKDDAQSWGGIQWARPVIDVMFDGASASVDFICRQILPNDNYFRLQVDLRGASDDLDDATEDNMKRLISVASGYLNSSNGERDIERIVSLLR